MSARTEREALAGLARDLPPVYYAEEVEVNPEGLADAILAAGFRRIDPNDEALVEKVARALCAAHRYDPDDEMGSGYPRWMTFRMDARAVLDTIEDAS